jgi:cell division protein FtsN
VKREEYKARVEELEEQAPLVFTPERKRDYSYLKYAAVFTAMMFAGAAGYKVYNDREVEAQTLLVEKAVQEKVQGRIQQATFLIDNPLPAVQLNVKALKAPDVKAGPYHIVAGAFENEANARKAMRQLSAKGFQPTSLGKTRYGLYAVAYGSYASRAEARKAIADIHKKHDREAWLLIKEL